jgi:hypothetical protein
MCIMSTFGGENLAEVAAGENLTSRSSQPGDAVLHAHGVRSAEGHEGVAL